MSDQRIILANNSRLLREMLSRILLKSDRLEVVQEVDDQTQLPAAIEQENAEWVIVSLPLGASIPGWAHTYLQTHPFTRIMAVSADGSMIKMKWFESHEAEFTDLTLKDLIHILENNSEHT